MRQQKEKTEGGWAPIRPTALLVLADGTVIAGQGAGAEGAVAAELCFNTALTGYEEILTDPSYTGQIVTFTFPHIGNAGANAQDIEILNPAQRHGAVGAVFKAALTAPSNYRAAEGLEQWLQNRGIIAITGIDTRALTALIREKGMPNAVIAHAADGKFDVAALKRQARQWRGLVGLDLARTTSGSQRADWRQTPWVWNEGYGEKAQGRYHIVAVDYGIKRNILRLLAGLDAKVTIVPAQSRAEDIIALRPDGIFLSNGPGDPAAMKDYAVPMLRALLQSGIPIFGICLGHQLLALAGGGKTVKMHQGHHGANHPVKDKTTGKVEIVSMNHGFAVDSAALPAEFEETHISLFDGSNCGLRVKGKPVFSVQHHPEASPGPQDSHYLFRRFLELIKAHKAKTGKSKNAA